MDYRLWYSGPASRVEALAGENWKDSRWRTESRMAKIEIVGGMW